jgi:Uma2 family endonuclease
MFNSRMIDYEIARPAEITDAYGHKRFTYSTIGTAKVYIVVQDRNEMNSNDLEIYKSTLIGYTNDARIQRGWLIDNKYLVKTTIPHRTATILYLEEIENG